MVAAFSTIFRIILPDTLDLSRRDLSGPRVDECELDALDTLCTKLKERQAIHRLSDREMVHNVSQVVRGILLQDDPGARFAPAQPGLYAVNCSGCHLVGASQLRSSGFKLPVRVSVPFFGPVTRPEMANPQTEAAWAVLTFPSKSDPVGESEVRLPPQSRCLYCSETITLAREVPLARQTWELLGSLQPDADTVNVERHLPTQFQLGPPKPENTGLLPPGYASMPGTGVERSREPGVYAPALPAKQAFGSPTSMDLPGSAYPGPVSPQSPSNYQPSIHLRSEPSRPDISIDQKRKALEEADPTFALLDQNFLTDPPPFSRDSPGFRRQLAPEETHLIHTPRTVPLVTSSEKGKSKWRLFTSSKKTPTVTVADSSSLSSTTLEGQRLDEVSLSALLGAQKSHSRGKPSKSTNVHLSQSSTLALFWTQLLIHVWDVGTSPPTMVRAVSPESTCILVAVAKVHLAYIIGTRDQKLTVRECPRSRRACRIGPLLYTFLLFYIH